MSPTSNSEPSGVHELIAKRWSPREFLDKPVDPAKLHSVFEAARWASTCFNEQPARFVTATRDDAGGFQRILGLLVEQNQKWARGAFLLGFSASKRTFTHNGAPNRFAPHDLGSASANLALEAVAQGLHTHFMGGFDAARARTEFGIPDDFEIGAAFAVGYIEEAAVKPGARSRKSLSETTFGTEWGKAAGFVG